MPNHASNTIVKLNWHFKKKETIWDSNQDHYNIRQILEPLYHHTISDISDYKQQWCHWTQYRINCQLETANLRVINFIIPIECSAGLLFNTWWLPKDWNVTTSRKSVALTSHKWKWLFRLITSNNWTPKRTSLATK